MTTRSAGTGWCRRPWWNAAEFAPFWEKASLRSVPAPVRRRVRSRLLFDAVMEFGLASRIGRTLEATGSVVAEVSATAGLAAIGRVVLANTPQDTLDSLAATRDADVAAWVRGVLERMRERGAIEHPWFGAYITEDGSRYRIWGGRPKAQGMPAFPKGRAAPAYPRIGPALPHEGLLDPVTSAQSWYARWTARVLHVSAQHGARLAKALFERLASEGIVRAFATASQATVYAVPHSSVLVSRPSLDQLAGEGVPARVCRVPQPVPGDADGRRAARRAAVPAGALPRGAAAYRAGRELLPAAVRLGRPAPGGGPGAFQPAR